MMHSHRHVYDINNLTTRGYISKHMEEKNETIDKIIIAENSSGYSNKSYEFICQTFFIAKKFANKLLSRGFT